MTVGKVILAITVGVTIASLVSRVLLRSNTVLFDVAALLLLTVHSLLRWIHTAWFPMSTLYEILVWFALSTFLFTSLAPLISKDVKPLALRLTSAVAGAALIYALTVSDSLRPPSPALRSPWFFWHIAVAVMAYPMFIYASFHVISYGRESVQALRKILAVAIVLYTFGIISGAAWAEEAWGTYWQWDPKETWALLTWFIYTAFYHSFHIRSAGATRAFAVVGLIFVGITFVGINFIVKILGIPSLHAYT